MKTKKIPFLSALEIIIDNRGKTAPISESGIPLIATNCISNEALYPEFKDVRYVSQETYETWFRGHPQSEDILFVNKGSPGRVCLVPDPVNFVIAQDMVSLRADRSITTPDFLLALLRTPKVQSQIVNMHVGTLIPHFKKGDFQNLILEFPDLATQEVIGKIYRVFSDKIELNRRMNRTLEQMARALFKSWFVDFDPVRAKMEGRTLEGMDAETAALFPDKLVEVDGREVPEGWRKTNLGELINVDKGLSYKGAFLTEAGTPMINLGTFFAGAGFKFSGIKYYSGDYKERHTVKAGDIVVANTDITQKREIIGSPAIIPKILGIDDILFTHHTFAVRNKGLVGQQFIYQLMQTEEYRGRVVGFAHGTTVLALPKDSLLDLDFILPTQELIKVFCSQADALFSQSECNSDESAHLAQLRDSLLPRLLSGEVDVSGWGEE